MDDKVVSQATDGAVVIRRATLEDAVALSEFGAHTFFESFAADNTADDMQTHLATAWAPALQRAELLDPAFETFLACDRSGALAGFAQLRAGPPPGCVRSENTIELLRFYVDKPWHGRGLARDLMNVAMNRARQQGARALWLGVWERNERAKAFYRKCGFERVGAKIFVVGSDPQTDDVMLCLL
jgi:ribosomal protein S18 acetylase RimI-like enzyme